MKNNQNSFIHLTKNRLRWIIFKRLPRATNIRLIFEMEKSHFKNANQMEQLNNY